MVVQDSKAKRSSAIMNVSVGSMQNPPDIPGLAHFLEHMLFMGRSIFFLNFRI
jgi:secreted Zn-dependent insulinase-like peptidase